MSANSPEIKHSILTKQLELALLNLNEFATHFNLTDKRGIEKQAAQYVVRTILNNDTIEILYKESGKPYLPISVNISISHSYDWLAVLFSFNGTEIGVDIEKVRDKILNIKDKFLSLKELEALKDASLEKHIVYWCVKEAVYKAFGKVGLIFEEQIQIEDFIYSQQGGKIYAYVGDADTKINYTLHYQIINEYILVYTANN
ncbi:MAG: 4'-phosphopantetheinyl transferase family protein [Bacteroidia bacterium]